MNKNGVRPQRVLTGSEQSNLNVFMNAVRAGTEQTEAAPSGDSKYTRLRSMRGPYKIPLSQGCRATFTVNTNTQTVAMLQVAGHA